MDGMVVIALSLVLAFIFSEVAYRLKYPRIVGHLFVGILMSFPIIKSKLFNNTVPPEIEILSELGIVFLLMLVGFEINLKQLKKTADDSLNIALLTIVISFSVGFIFVSLLGYHYIVAMIVGVCFALSAEATTIDVLIETRTLNSKIGSILLSVGIVDDLFGMIFLGSLLTIVSHTYLSIFLSPFLILLFALLVLFIFKYVPKMIVTVEKEHSSVSIFSSVVVVGIAIAAISKLLGLGYIIGAFLAGLFLRWAIKNKHIEHESIKELKIMTFALIIPFFFINVGLHFDLGIFFRYPLLILVITVFATISKLIGPLIVSLYKDISYKQAMVIGWGLNSRGAIELIILEMARKFGIIPSELYGAIVVMAVATTLVFPLIFRYYLRNNKGIMNK